MKSIQWQTVSKPYWWMSVILASGVFAVGSATIEDQQEKVFTVGPGSFLVMNVDRGGIDIKTSNAKEVRIQITRQVQRLSAEKGRKVLAEHTVTMEQAAERVSVQARFPEDTSLSNREKSRLQVAYTMDVEAQTSGGRVDADLEFSTVTHRSRTALQAQMNGGGKNLRLQTSGGDITIRER